MPTRTGTPGQVRSGSEQTGIIDIHHHFFSPEMKTSWVRGSHEPPPLIANWSPSRMHAEMDENRVAGSVLSVASAPLHWFDMPHAASRTFVRSINEYGAGLVREKPLRHGLFAFILGKDIDGSLKEIEYSLDTLGADGIELATSFGDVWPGDPRFHPIFEELNRRDAVVYFHPLSPACCDGLISGAHSSWIEYPHDTTRAITSLLINGVFAKFPKIRFIFSHGGGTLPIMAERLEFLTHMSRVRESFAPEGTILPTLRRLYFDTANATSAPMMAALDAFTDADHLLFGSDTPYVPINKNLNELMRGPWSGEDLDKIVAGNARRLIPRLQS
jgi:predicted TIM-barrel fold metal-dependent hydrolase